METIKNIAEVATDVGSLGASSVLLFGSDADGGADNAVHSTHYEVADYWRGDGGVVQANARVSAASVDLPADRTSAWVGKIRGVGGNRNMRFAGEFTAEQQQGRAVVAARITFGT